MKKANYRIPLYLVILMNILGFLLVFMKNEYNVNVLYIGLGLMGLFVAVYIGLVIFRMGDRYLFLIVSMLITIGVLILCQINLKTGVGQILYIGLGGVAFFVSYIMFHNFGKWNKMWLVYAVLCVGLLFVTYKWGTGKEETGAQLWLDIGGFTVQPSEFIKIFYIMFLACYYSKSWNKPFMSVHPTLVTSGLSLAMAAFFAVMNDWGSILVFMSVYLFMMYVFETRRWFFVLCVIGGIAAVALIVTASMTLPSVGDKIQSRINGWIDPWAHRSNEGYQIVLGLNAISSGKYFGVGLGNANLGDAGFFAIESDYIFAAICAEMGIFMGAAVILLFFLLSYRCFKIALNAHNSYNKAVALGIGLMFSLQTFIIIGGVINLIPLTGITVPFVSAGGSSVIASFASLGIIQAISADEERRGVCNE